MQGLLQFHMLYLHENENSIVDKSNTNSCINLEFNGYNNQEALISFIKLLLCSLIFILFRGIIRCLPLVFMDHLKLVGNLSDGLLQ